MFRPLPRFVTESKVSRGCQSGFIAKRSKSMSTASSSALLDAELRNLPAETLQQVAKTLLQDDLEGFCQEAWSVIGEQNPFISARYWSVLCEHLTAVSVGAIRRLIINVPPRFGKSTLVSVLWPCWEWARDGARSKW